MTTEGGRSILWCSSIAQSKKRINTTYLAVAKAWQACPNVNVCIPDPFVSIGIPVDVLRQWQYCHGTWLIATCPMSSRQRLVQVVAIDTLLGDDVDPHVFLSPAAMFNLGITPFSWGQITLQRANTTARPLLKDTVVVASSATIARVRRAHVSTSEAPNDQKLAEFFQTRRIVAIGDVICVPYDKKPPRREYDNAGVVLPPYMIHGGSGSSTSIRTQASPVVDNDRSRAVCYYKVIDMQSPSSASPFISMAIVQGETILVEASSVSSTIPSIEFLTPQVSTSTTQMCCSPLGCNYSHVYSRDALPMHDEDAFHQLMELLLPVWNATLEPTSCSSRLPMPLTIVLEGSRGSGQSDLLDNAAKCIGFHIVHKTFAELSSTPSEQQIAESIQTVFEQAAYLGPCIVHLDGAFGFTIQEDDAMSELALATALLQAVQDANQQASHPVVLVSSVPSVDEIPDGLRDCFLHEIRIESPDESTRLDILNRLLPDSTYLDEQVDASFLASRIAGRNLGEIQALIADAGAKALEKTQGCGTDDPPAHSLSISVQDFQQAIGEQQTPVSLALGSPSIPNVKWEDIGGLEHIKAEILDVVQLPLQCPELFAGGVRQRSGILFYGPPGTGKTLVAKAIATECGLNFISVKGPELLNMYIGESEKNVRHVFETARNARPCVLFFDELDSLAPMRGRGSDSGGVMDRIVSQLLTELDGAQQGTEVFVIGATNRPDLLESALLRPGRFDRLLYLGIATDRDTQLKILHALTRKFTLDSDVDFNAMLDRAGPLTMLTGADFYALCSTALAQSIQDKVMALEAYVEQENRKDCYSSSPPLTIQSLLASASPSELHSSVKQEHFLQAFESIVPSVSSSELAHYERLRDQFSSSGSVVKGKHTINSLS